MKRIVTLSLLFVAFSASTSIANSPCGIRPPKETPESALASLATVNQADAEKAALAGFANFAVAATVAESELEVERGCLVYSFDVQVAGKKGVEEVLVDAGTGKVLSREHETSKQEAAEARHEAKKAAAAKAKTPTPPPAAH